MEIIDRIYTDPKTGFISAQKLYQKVKESNPEITLKQVNEYLANSTTQQLHTKKKKPQEEAKIYGKFGQYQLDLTFLSQYKSKNSNYHIILVAVEINTRYAYALALKSKSQQSMADALESLIKQMTNDKRKPTIFQSDNGTEFKNKIVATICENNMIKQIFCQEGDKKCLAIAERFNRTIKGMINKYMTQNNTVRWIDALPEFIENYNNTVHSTIKMKPKDVSIAEQSNNILNAIEHNTALKKSHNINVGDKVRLPLSKTKFEKEGKNFTDEVYIVSEVLLTNLKVDGKTKKYRIAEVLKVPNETEDANTANIKEAKKESRIQRQVQREGLEVNNSTEPAPKRKAALKARELNRKIV